jgi:hypothetical protein
MTMIPNQNPATTIPMSLASDPRLAVEILSSQGMINIKTRDATKVILRTIKHQVIAQTTVSIENIFT